MPYGKLNSANFHAQMAPENTHGRGLQPIDQCARAIMQERRDECRLEEKGVRPLGYGMGISANGYDNWRERHNITEKVTKRMTTGGMTRRPEDALLNSPRGRSRLTMRDL